MKKSVTAVLAVVLAVGLSVSTFAMELSVKSVTGKDFTLKVNPTDSIEYIKLKIYDAEGYATDSQRLVLSGTELEDWRPLQDYSVPAGGSVDLVLRSEPLDLVGIAENGVGRKRDDDEAAQNRQFWDEIRLDIDDAENGAAITPDLEFILSGGDEIPYFVVTALYGRDVTLKLDAYLLGPLSIHGTDIKSIDSSVISYTVEEIYEKFKK